MQRQVFRRLVGMGAAAVLWLPCLGFVQPVTAATSAYANAVLSDNPTAYYRLDEASGPTLIDSAAAPHNGLYSSSGLTFGVAGATGDGDTAISGNGTSQPATVAVNSLPSGNGSFTIEAWFKTTSTADQALADWGVVANQQIVGLAYWHSDYYTGVACSCIVADLYSEALDVGDTTTVGINLVDGSWHLLDLTYDGSAFSGYADGKLVRNGVKPLNGPMNIQPSELRIGYWIDTYFNQWLNGSLDDLAIYSQALPDARIAAHFTAAGATPRPNPPQNVTNIGNAAGNVLVGWQPPVPNGATLNYYNVYELSSTGLRLGVRAQVGAAATDLSAIVHNLNLCTYYTFGVTAVGSDGQESDLAKAARQAFTQGSPSSPPPTVTILVQGINSHDRLSTFNPLDVFDYCTTVDGVYPNDAGTTYPPALADMQAYWDQDSQPAHQPAYGAGNRLIDTLASHGGLVLPFSYHGATMSGTASAPLFTFFGYTSSDVANTPPGTAARTLELEIESINAIWPTAKILVVGHSNGGLIAEMWWLAYGAQNPRGVVQAFALDSPLNGIADPTCATDNVCQQLGIGPVLGSTYQELWTFQTQLDPLYAKVEAQKPLFTAVGTTGDPVYDFADQAAAKNASHNMNIGLASQVWFSEPSCSQSGFDVAQSSCALLGSSFIDPCGPLDDGNPPFFGLPGDEWLHGVVENCAQVIAKIMSYAS